MQEIKSDQKLKIIPVCILTSSTAERDVMQAYELHANSYLAKPVRLEDFSNIVTAIEKFWFVSCWISGWIKCWSCSDSSWR